MPRDYQKENKYKAKPEQIKLRGIRNKARLAAIKSGKAKVGDGTSVEHIKPLSKGGKNTPGIFKKKTTKKKTTKK